MKDGCLGEERLTASGVDDSHLPVPQAIFWAVCLPSCVLALQHSMLCLHIQATIVCTFQMPSFFFIH